MQKTLFIKWTFETSIESDEILNLGFFSTMFQVQKDSGFELITCSTASHNGITCICRSRHSSHGPRYSGHCSHHLQGKAQTRIECTRKLGIQAIANLNHYAQDGSITSPSLLLGQICPHKWHWDSNPKLCVYQHEHKELH